MQEVLGARSQNINICTAVASKKSVFSGSLRLRLYQVYPPLLHMVGRSAAAYIRERMTLVHDLELQRAVF